MFIYLAVLGLSCRVWDLHLSCGMFCYNTWSLVVAHMGSACGMHRLSCPLAYGILVLPTRD